MEKIVVNSFSEFVSQVQGFELTNNLVLFRGQNREGNLLPGIARKDPSVNTEKIERKNLEQLALLGAAMPEINGKSQLDLMVMAQHFGLKTRLLDWSSNPLVALWFACESKEEEDGYVYALTGDDLQDPAVYSKDPYGKSNTLVFQPKQNNARIVAQHGWFTLHKYSLTMKKFVSLELNKKIKNNLTEFCIPYKCKQDIFRSLEINGISSRTLLPDLGGLCAYLNWKHELI